MLGENRIRDDSELFDETSGYEDEVGIQLTPGLSTEEIKRATVLYNLFNELWGVCIVVGVPGTGKDLFGNYISYQIKRFFPHKRILRDEKPRRLYGEYAGIFNDRVLKEELARMSEIAQGVSAVRIDGILEKAADRWVTEAGEVMLKNSVLYLTEYWRYCYNREPHNPMNKTMGAIHKTKRHLDCLILGTVQLPSELDKKTCLPWVDWKVTCSRSATNPTGFVYLVQKVSYDRRVDALLPIGRPFPIAFDAGSPKSYLGDGRIILKPKRLAYYRPETEEERIVLNVLKSGVDTFDGIVDLLDREGDMEEWEVLATLKELKFRKYKRVVDYPCFFGLYNSKSAPQIKTTLRVSEE